MSVGAEEPQNLISIILPYPWLLKLPVMRHLSGYAKMEPPFKAIKNIIAQKIREHLEAFDGSSNLDLMDVIIKHIKNTEDKQSSFYGDEGLETLVCTLLSLFVAGSETTGNTLVWSCLYLLHHPDVQMKVHLEIDRVIGQERKPSLADKESMPYINAFIEETHRKTALTPLLLHTILLLWIKLEKIAQANDVCLHIPHTWVHISTFSNLFSY